MSKRNNHPDEPPKKPLNGYFRFQVDPEIVAMITKQNPDGKNLKSKFGELWRSMSEKEKEPY
jgi:hypothetical protein